ncbi:MAG: zf-TFIIB domain-containing protein [Thermoanaerobaculia bacterium]|nr:zf-TFIIB domain-containing protein [Thermoanaerobaculia bacterium]
MEFEDVGYDKESQYFFRQNQELIERKRAELNKEREARRESELKEQHWMRCPKCGQPMVEEELSGIMIDRCGSCQGIFFDAGELDLLLAAKGQAGFLGGLKKLVGGS